MYVLSFHSKLKKLVSTAIKLGVRTKFLRLSLVVGRFHNFEKISFLKGFIAEIQLRFKICQVPGNLQKKILTIFFSGTLFDFYV